MMRDTGERELDAALDELVQAERAQCPAPSAALTARVLADAAAVTPRPAEAVPRSRRRPRFWPAGFALPATVAAWGLACLLIGIGIGYGTTDTAGAATALDEAVFAGLDAGAVPDFPL